MPSQSAPGDEVAESPLRISIYEAFGALELESLDFNSTGAFAAFSVFFLFFLLDFCFPGFCCCGSVMGISLFTLISSMDGKIVSSVSRVLLLPHDSEILRWAGRRHWHCHLVTQGVGHCRSKAGNGITSSSSVTGSSAGTSCVSCMVTEVGEHLWI